MIADEIMKDLEPLGGDLQAGDTESRNQEPFFGVKIEYLKKIQKRIKDYQIALDLRFGSHSLRNSLVDGQFPDINRMFDYCTQLSLFGRSQPRERRPLKQ